MSTISRSWLKLFLFSTIILVVLLFWSGFNRGLSKLNMVFSKDVVRNRTSAGDWQEYNASEFSPASNHVNFSEKSRTDFKAPIEPTVKLDTTRSKQFSENETILPLVYTESVKSTDVSNGNVTAVLYTESSQASKTDLTASTHALKTPIYGEEGCPDNPRREVLFQLLRKWVEISKQNNIEYVLACGSLLGAMRNSDIIPYDTDIDILLNVSYFPIMVGLSERRNFDSFDGKSHLVVQRDFMLNIPVDDRKRLNCEGKEVPNMADQCAFQEPMARFIKGNNFLDFFHFYDRHHTVEDPSEERLKRYPKEDFYPFLPCRFMGIEASCPHRPWEILRIYFGTDNLEPKYKCQDGDWVNPDHPPPRKLRRSTKLATILLCLSISICLLVCLFVVCYTKPATWQIRCPR